MSDRRSRLLGAAIRGGASLAVLCLLNAAVQAGPSAYTLGPQDKVRLKVYEWRAAKDEIFEVEAFSDDFVVGRVQVDPWDWPIEVRLKALGAYRWMAWWMHARRGPASGR